MILPPTHRAIVVTELWRIRNGGLGLTATHAREKFGAFHFGARPGFVVGEAFGLLFRDVADQRSAAGGLGVIRALLVAEFAGLARCIEGRLFVGERGFSGGEVF